MDYILLFSVIMSFLLTIVVLPYWIKKARQVGLLWEDLNKYKRGKDVAASGGIVVVMSFVLSLLFYIFLKTFLLGRTSHELEIFAVVAVVLIFSLIGLVDDLLGWSNGGLSSRVRIVLALIASVPLVVINAGTQSMILPFVGVVDLGVIYPLLVIPLVIGFVATTYNFLAGFNGLEAGQGILILSFLSFVAFYQGAFWLSLVGLCMVASLVVFLFYNFNPAKVFPGDILTYSVGALIASMAILGSFEKVALIVFVPYLFEVGLKLRGKLRKSSFGQPDKKNNLSLRYKKIYGMTHFGIWFLSKFKKEVREEEVVYFIYSVQIFFILIAFLFLVL